MLKISAFYINKQKCFIPKKVWSVQCTLDSSIFSQQLVTLLACMALDNFTFHFCYVFLAKTYTHLHKLERNLSRKKTTPLIFFQYPVFQVQRSTWSLCPWHRSPRNGKRQWRVVNFSSYQVLDAFWRYEF